MDKKLENKIKDTQMILQWMGVLLLIPITAFVLFSAHLLEYFLRLRLGPGYKYIISDFSILLMLLSFVMGASIAAIIAIRIQDWIIKIRFKDKHQQKIARNSINFGIKESTIRKVINRSFIIVTFIYASILFLSSHYYIRY